MEILYLLKASGNECIKVQTRVFLHCLYFTNSCDVRESLKNQLKQSQLKHQDRFPFVKELFTYTLLKTGNREL